MTGQPDDVLDEAARLFEVLRRRIRENAVSSPRPQPGDVWGQATFVAPTPHIATGAPECQYCPVCRAIAAARTSSPGLVDRVMDVGQPLYAAVREVLSAYEKAQFDRSHCHTAPERERAAPTPPRPREERPGVFQDPTDIG